MKVLVARAQREDSPRSYSTMDKGKALVKHLTSNRDNSEFSFRDGPKNSNGSIKSFQEALVGKMLAHLMMV